MPIKRWLLRWTLTAAAGLAAGCHHCESDKIHYLGDADLKYYKNQATRVDYANVCIEPNRDAVATDEPRTVSEPRKDEICDVTLLEMLHTALSNNKIIRTAGQFLAIGGTLYSNPNQAPSVYDPAIQESGVLFGGRGVEAALADFDATFSTSMLWGRDERVQNVFPGPTLQTDTGVFNQRIQKQNALGGTVGVNQNWNYLYSNAAGTLFPSTYTGQISVDYRQPLWAGAGPEFTRIAGPISTGFAAITGVSQGVLIARINEDISIADFEAQVRNMLKDVEDTYWDLYLAYRNYDTLVTARNSALRTWREEKLKLSVGKGDPADEAQARDQYFDARSLVNRALSDIYTNEIRLRRMVGLPVNDCRVLRPKDEPATAEFVTDWRASLAEALTRRVELRRQKWNIKSLELQLLASKSLTNPRLDFVSQYRRNGFGDDLFGGTDDGVTPNGLHSAFGTVANGNQDGWNLGFEFSMPLGFRSAHAQVRNIELRLAKAREVLAVQELEISHELAVAVQNVSVNFENTKTTFNRRVAAEERVRLFSERERVGTVTTDLVLRAQASLAQADIAYFTNLVNYSKSLTDYYFRRGTLLEHNNVRISEDRWKPEAYKEALRRAWARSHALPNPLLDTEPDEFASPRPYKAKIFSGYGAEGEGRIIEGTPTEGAPQPKLLDREERLDVPPAPPEAPGKDPEAGPMTSYRRRTLDGLGRSSRTEVDDVGGGFQPKAERVRKVAHEEKGSSGRIYPRAELVDQDGAYPSRSEGLPKKVTQGLRSSTSASTEERFPHRLESRIPRGDTGRSRLSDDVPTTKTRVRRSTFDADWIGEGELPEELPVTGDE